MADVFHDLTHCQTIFQSGCIAIHSHQPHVTVPVAPVIPTLASQFFKILAILIISFFFICISLMTNDVKHLLMCLFIFFRKTYVQISSIFKNWVVKL